MTPRIHDFFTSEDTGILLTSQEKRKILNEAIPVMNLYGLVVDPLYKINILKQDISDNRIFVIVVRMGKGLIRKEEFRFKIDLDKKEIMASDFEG